MAYRSSPLNPHARGVGKRIPTVKNESVEDGVVRAVSAAEDTGGKVTVNIKGKDLTIDSRDDIAKIVAQARRDLGLPPSTR